REARRTGEPCTPPRRPNDVGTRIPAGCGTSRGGGSDQRRRRRKGRGRAPQPSAAPHGAGVQTGGDGRGRGGARHPSRVQRPTGPGFKQAATAKEGAGPGTPAGGGTPRSEGSNRQRQRKGRGGASRPGAAPHGVRVQTGSDSDGRDGAVFTVWACAPSKGACPICRVQ